MTLCVFHSEISWVTRCTRASYASDKATYCMGPNGRGVYNRWYIHPVIIYVNDRSQTYSLLIMSIHGYSDWILIDFTQHRLYASVYTGFVKS